MRLSPSPGLREREGPTPQAWEGEGFAFPQSLKYRLAYPFYVGQDFIVPETQDAPTASVQPKAAVSVALAGCMLTAIGFDDHEKFRAGKIHDKRADRNLAAKFVGLQSVAP
jgi:hypothetical protein